MSSTLPTTPPALQREAFATTLAWYQARGLVSAAEVATVLGCFEPAYPFAAAMGLADSFHLHIKVDDVMRLPHGEIAAAGGAARNAKDGYIKYEHAGGLNMIFSSIPVAEDDRLPEPAAPRAKPFVDHLGIDLRREAPEVKAAFDAVPGQARALGWAQASQGGDRPVYCCHVEVGAKHWAYPATPEAGLTTEFAYGPLKVNADSMGCDLRPLDPRHPQAAGASCCG